ncbi:MAG TPA: hypothetical protein VF170_06345 [Planctomycetaceae bacterium]
MATSTVEFGDFQTPPALARRVCRLLRESGLDIRSVVEPTCGIGNFLSAAMDAFPHAGGVGYEINDGYVGMAAAAVAVHGTRVVVRRADFFELNWKSELSRLPGPILVVGNPPWVTSATLGAIGGVNLPEKSNFRRRRGIEAVTGKSNFDISEWMLLEIAEALSGREAAIAVLVKEAVARKVLLQWWERDCPLSDARIYSIDAPKAFGASVAACLFFSRFGDRATARECRVFGSFDDGIPPRTLGSRGGRIVADVDAFDRWRHLAGTDRFRWRSGVKHDCAGVMELKAHDGRLTNGLGETVELEEELVFPLLKGSDIAKGRTDTPSRRMLITQRSPADETASIERNAPLSWRYLCRHRHLFERRKSSIYRGRPDFAIFGIGDYTFAPYKVAVAGLAKELAFRKVPPAGKPVVLDDTVCFLPASSEEDADLMLALLNAGPAREFLSSQIYWESKRPITVDVLETLDLDALAAEIGLSREMRRVRPYGAATEPKREQRQRILFGQ